MRPSTALLALLWVAPATSQDAPSRTGAAESVFTFSAEQGWNLTVESERELTTISERELLEGTQPFLRLTRTNPADVTRPTGPDPRRTAPVPAPPPSGPIRPTLRHEPFKIEGSAALRPDGTVVLSFQRLEYWDSIQRWRIQYEGSKVRTLELGGVSKWSGTRPEWALRLDDLERAFVEGYLKAVTPQKPETARGTVGLVPAAADPGRRLYVASCLEEQLTVLLLSRLEGAVLSKTLWPAECAAYPPRVVQLARAVVERLVAQCAGEMAPAKARTSRTRTVKDQPWDGSGLAVPTLQWPDGAAWAAEQAKPVQEARRRLADLAAQSNVNGGILESAWKDAVRRELETTEAALRLVVPAKAPSVQDPLLTPRLLSVGKATYDFKEALNLKDGKVHSSSVEAQGLAKDFEVAFFVSGQNRWKASRIRLELWYRGQIKRKES